MPISLEAFPAECDKVLQFLHAEFAKLQTGRANAALVEHVEVEAYGSKQQLQAIAGISIEESRTIAVQPWDSSIMTNVEQALQKADLGVTPMNDGHVIRLTLPPMTEERRTQFSKRVHDLAEEARISVRHLRHETQEEIRKETDEDLRETQLGNLQKAVDEVNGKIEEAMKKKEEEVMTV